MTRKFINMKNLHFIGVVFLFFSLLTGCAVLDIRRPKSVLDTPEHHYANGMKLYERGQYEKAGQSFTMAGELDPNFAPAYVGSALIASAKKDFQKAKENLDRAWSNTGTDEHRTLVLTGYVRVASEQKAGDDWIDGAEYYFEKGLEYGNKDPQLHYYMGVAYKQAYQFDKAGDKFINVLELNSDLMVEADHEWSQVQKIKLAAPGTEIGKQIALIEKIDRADTAALLMHELKLDKLYRKRKASNVKYKSADGTELKVKSRAEGATGDVSYKSANGAELKVKNKVEEESKTKAATVNVKYKGQDGTELKVKKPVRMATDIKNHVLAGDIKKSIRMNIRGLRPFRDNTFRPDQPVTRAEYAVIVKDIILKVSGDKRQASLFSTSPFPDVPSDFWAYNAIVFATGKGIMEAKDVSTGEFRTQAPVSGADALLIIRKIKDELNRHNAGFIK